MTAIQKFDKPLILNSCVVQEFCSEIKHSVLGKDMTQKIPKTNKISIYIDSCFTSTFFEAVATLHVFFSKKTQHYY